MFFGSSIISSGGNYFSSSGPKFPRFSKFSIVTSKTKRQYQMATYKQKFISLCNDSIVYDDALKAYGNIMSYFRSPISSSKQLLDDADDYVQDLTELDQLVRQQQCTVSKPPCKYTDDKPKSSMRLWYKRQEIMNYLEYSENIQPNSSPKTIMPLHFPLPLPRSTLAWFETISNQSKQSWAMISYRYMLFCGGDV